MFGGYNKGPSLQEQQMQAMMEQRQMKDFMKMYVKLVNNCFDDCINGFEEKNLTDNEIACTRKCTQKFMKVNERVGARFSEEHQKMLESQIQQ
ncbi:hypothetical protein BB560_004238 [Smittium megazygosporum]|uniref:Mitochondrial import inner membrane translocase subunit n=1 Tax=Smittium megazygosporum TaxID=133381 RepID=A0A2T9Z9V6_9FUNG|nr:hypothetical protein BB560_004238 [Smittium megazygosporum]